MINSLNITWGFLTLHWITGSNNQTSKQMMLSPEEHKKKSFCCSTCLLLESSHLRPYKTYLKEQSVVLLKKCQCAARLFTDGK